jgi:hypothetical protein
MPEKETLERAEEDKREGKAPSTQAESLCEKKSSTFANANTVHWTHRPAGLFERGPGHCLIQSRLATLVFRFCLSRLALGRSRELQA